MKQILLAIIITCSLNGFLLAQESLKTRVLFSQKNGRLSLFLNEIETQTEVQFLYDNSRINVHKRQIELIQQEMTVKDFLEYILSVSDFTYIIREDKVILKPEKKETLPDKVTVSGRLTTAGLGEHITGAHILDSNSKSGVISNDYGFYSITLTPGPTSLLYSYAGYQYQHLNLELERDTAVNLVLPSVALSDVTISDQRSEYIQESSEMAVLDLTDQQIKSTPVIGGEVDVVKTLQLLPGVQSGFEGYVGLYVRGGGVDQNLTLLDGVPLYNVSHLFGLMSVFNADAIQNVSLIKGAFPARYGGRLSSVMDVSMKEGNRKEFHGEGAVGLIASKLTLEGPLFKGKTSYLISGRRTYVDFLAGPFIGSDFKTDTRKVDETWGYHFYDVNVNVTHRFSDKDKLYFSVYSGGDASLTGLDTETTDIQRTAREIQQTHLNWGTDLALLRWSRTLNDKLQGHLSISRSSYDYQGGEKHAELVRTPGRTRMDFYQFQTSSLIKDWAARMDFDYQPNARHRIRTGLGVTLHEYSPNVVAVQSEAELDTAFFDVPIRAREYMLYFEDDFSVFDRLKLNVGVHISGFDVNNTLYNSIQPRISGRFLLSDALSIKASYTRMTQFMSMLTNPGGGFPTDFWVPATDRVLPQMSYQYAAGVAYTHPENHFELTIEWYHKQMNNLLEYKEGAGFLSFQQDWQDRIESGRGENYGIEFLLKKQFGRTNGWVGYTLSWANRTFENINGGQTFPYKFDRRHDLNTTVNHQLSKKVSIAANWVFNTGVAITLPQAEYLAASENASSGLNAVTYLNSNSTRNAHRLRPHHRLDLSVHFAKKKKWGEREWVVTIYNVYNRKNPFFIEQVDAASTNSNGNDQFKEVSLMPIIPSVSYRFKF